MNEDIVESLRRSGQLTPMSGGKEGVPITLQFMGKVPPLQRPERKEWLKEQFFEWQSRQDKLPVELDSQSISLSGQTVSALGAADHLDDIRKAAESENLNMTVAQTFQAVDFSS